MLRKKIKGFLRYRKISPFKARSLQTLTIRFYEFNMFLEFSRILRIKSVAYSKLSAFVDTKTIRLLGYEWPPVLGLVWRSLIPSF